MKTIEYINIDLVRDLQEVEKLIGGTPVLDFSYLSSNSAIQILAKAEWEQLGGSVKARPAFNIIKNGLLQHSFDGGKQLLDASSGNTGIAYAAIGKAIGLGVTLVIPENASKERKEILEEYGANIIYSSKFESTDGAQTKAKELAIQYPNKYYYVDQYANNNNWRAHYDTTGNEIIDATRGGVTHFIAGLGTTGTFIGTSRRLKDYNSTIKTISLQPETALHGLEGWKHLETAFVPPIYDKNLADENWFIDTMKTYEMIRKVYDSKGILLSPSSAANLVGAVELANKIDNGVIVTMLPDNADKYSEVLEQIFPDKESGFNNN